MSPEELRSSLRVLLAIAQADGDVDADERLLLAGVAEQLDAPLGSDEHVDIDAELATLASEDAKAITFRAAVAMASVDGQCSPAEHALLRKVRDALAPDDELPLETVETQWKARMRKTRTQLDRESDAFLDQVAANKSALTKEAYEKMVVELDRKKTALLKDAVDAED
jgi:tellurite resistance protein